MSFSTTRVDPLTRRNSCCTMAAALASSYLGRRRCPRIQLLHYLGRRRSGPRFNGDVISRLEFRQVRQLYAVPIQRPYLPMCRQHPHSIILIQPLRHATNCSRPKTTDATTKTSATNYHNLDTHNISSKKVFRPEYILELTQTLLSPNNNPRKKFEQTLVHSRRDDRLLRKMQLTSDEARGMYILPQALLTDVHSAIMHFSKKENFQGMVIHWKEDEGSLTQVTSVPKGKKKLPGPMICVKLLELIGIPHMHASLSSQSAAQSSNDASLKTIVHSSQVDQILECCLETAAALSRSCQTGKYSLLGNDLRWQSDEDGVQLNGGRKSAAQLCEEIWRSIWNMQIHYTSARNSTHHIPPRIRIGRIGSIGNANINSVEVYLSAVRDGMKHSEDNDVTSAMNAILWSPKDQRRYDKSVIIFNTVLAAYAKLTSSASGARPEMRRDMAQKAEQLLLEVSSKSGTTGILEPSPSTVLQCLEPDVISFNTILKAWSEFSHRHFVPKGRNNLAEAELDQDLNHVGTVVAERTESILEQMQSIWDEERSTRTTLQSIRFAHEGRGEVEGRGGRTIAPNTSSYNSVLKAWSRCSDAKAAVRALQVYRSMIHQSNTTCHARYALALERQLVENAVPDSRTFVLLLQSLQNISLSMSFRDAFDAIDLVIDSMKQWDKQTEWSAKKRIAPSDDAIILNAFSHNTLITTLSKLPRSWEENYQCCLRIDSIIDGISHASQLRPAAAVAWVKCAAHADNLEQLQLCAKKSGAHIDALLNSMQSPDDDNFSESGKHYIHAISDAIELYGRAGFPSKADELFQRAKSFNLHSLTMLSTIISALCHDGTEDIAFVDKAKHYLLEFESETMRMSHLLVVPDMKYTKMYNAVIAGYLNCNMKERGLKNAKALLTHMLSSNESNPRHIARPNTTSFARVMSALAQRGDNTRLLEELLKKMEELNQRRKRVLGSSTDAELAAHVVPNIVVYNILLKAYARSKDEDALQSAMKLLAQMEADPTLNPDEISNSYVLELLSRKDDGPNTNANASPSDKILGGSDMVNLDSGNINLEEIDSDNIHLEDLNLNGQTHPTSKSLTSIINVHLTTGTIEGARKGAELFEKLVEMHRCGRSGFKPDIVSYNKVMNAWRLCEPNKNDDDISPAEKAQEILDTVCNEHDSGGELSPNDVTFSIGIHAWCKSNRSDAAERAEHVLRRKEIHAKKCNGVNIKPSDYTPVISKWKDDPINGPERATLLFDEMLRRHGNNCDDQSRPDAATLNALLDVYAKWHGRNLAHKAECYLRKMNRLYEEGSICFSPDVISYRSVIDAWTRSWNKESPQRVSALVDEMIYKYQNEGRYDLRPDSNAFNLILKACSTAPATWEGNDSKENGGAHPIAIANRVFTMLKSENEFSAKVTHATYSFMFTIYRRHLDFRDKRHSSVLQNLWKHCCHDGMVSKFSLDTFRESVLEHDFWEAIGGKDNFQRLGKMSIEKITVEDLPSQWSRGVLPLRRR